MTMIIMYHSLFIIRHIRNEKKSFIYPYTRCELIECGCPKYDEFAGFHVRTRRIVYRRRRNLFRLGGVGIALRGENVINDANPASLTGLLPQYFFFDLGVSGSYLKYSQSGASNHSLNGNLNNLAVGFRIAPVGMELFLWLLSVV